MPNAYVLFNVSSGSENQVLENLRGIDEVQEAFFCYGVYDLVVKIEVDSMENLKKLVSQNLRIITDVKSTITLIEVNEKKLVVNK